MRPGGWGSADEVGNYSSFNQPASNIRAPMSTSGQPMKSMGGMPMANAKPDPFSSLGGFGTNFSAKATAPSANSSGMGSGSTRAGASAADFSLGAFQNANPTKLGGSGSSRGGSLSSPPQQPPPPQNPPKNSMDSFDSLFSSSTAGAPASEEPGTQRFSEMNGHDSSGPTMELEGLPPPPSSVTAPAAKSKGQDNYKQGQFADAIKWLSWAVCAFGEVWG